MDELISTENDINIDMLEIQRLSTLIVWKNVLNLSKDKHQSRVKSACYKLLIEIHGSSDSSVNSACISKNLNSLKT
ncbi:hypothetical protein AHAT_40590 [Agarivorans sp. Toyoura001]|nr:hypothetical protein AHAT_40590 [Agarivorans sp. Toyoura001]